MSEPQRLAAPLFYAGTALATVGSAVGVLEATYIATTSDPSRGALRTATMITLLLVASVLTVPHVPGLCLDRSGEPLEGKQARQSMYSSVDLRMNTDIGSYIYQYSSRDAAVRAWNNLNSLAAQCEGRIEVDLSDEGISTRMVVNTTVSQTRPLYGTAGLTLVPRFRRCCQGL